VKISVKVPNIHKTVSKVKTLLVKLPLKQKLIFGGIAVVVLGGVLTTGVIALNSNTPQVVKTAPVAHVKKTPAKKVADASTTAPTATPQPAATAQPTATPAPAATPTNCPPRVYIRPGPTAVIPDSRGCPVTYKSADTTPQTPIVTVTPPQITSSRFTNLFGSFFVNSSGVNNEPLNWAVVDTSGKLTLTGLPTGAVKNFDLGVGGAWLPAGTYTITITGTHPTSGLSATQTATLVLTDDPLTF
jgi:hypothetical protein